MNEIQNYISMIQIKDKKILNPTNPKFPCTNLPTQNKRYVNYKRIKNNIIKQLIKNTNAEISYSSRLIQYRGAYVNAENIKSKTKAKNKEAYIKKAKKIIKYNPPVKKLVKKVNK